MKGKLIWLNVVLAALLIAAVLRVRTEWMEGKQREVAVREHAHKPAPPPAVSVSPPPGGVTAASYGDIAQKMLFARDRNPDVVVEVPAAPPAKPMPPLPILRGVMGLPDGMVALMSPDAKSRTSGIRVGEKVGEFKVSALSGDEISMTWEDKTVTKSVSEMIRNVPEPPTAGAGAAPVAAPSAPATPEGANAAPPSGGQSGKPFTEVAGSSAGIKNCAPGDSAPAGTIADGYRKVVTSTPFGSACRWEPVK